jgi:hypothetical protein
MRSSLNRGGLSEKADLVDRISGWLFSTSFILLNIVYWALFGDHDLW